jgi:signal transduction histidine kinase
MKTEIEKATLLYESKMYDKALEILLTLEQNEIEDKSLRVKILEEIYKNYKEQGNLESALKYFKKFTEEEYQIIKSENKEKTDKLNSALKIHSAQKEAELLQEKNDELNKANEELNGLREKKNELLTIISEELKVPIVTIEGIAFNYYRTLNENRAPDVNEIKNELAIIESLSNEILQNVNSILQKNKEENEL